MAVGTILKSAGEWRDGAFCAAEADFEDIGEAFGLVGVPAYVGGAVAAGDGDFGFAGAAGVAFEGGFQVGDEEVAGGAVAGLVGEAEVGFAAGDGGVGVVDDEVALRCDAGFDEAVFAGAGVREVHADAEVGGGKVAFVEGAFAGALQSNKNYGLHRVLCSGKFMGDANRSIILRSRAYALCCGNGLAAITSVADRREHGRIVSL